MILTFLNQHFFVDASIPMLFGS